MHNFLESPSLDLFYDARTSNEETYVAESDVGFSNEVKSGGLIAGKLWDAKTMEVAMHWITERSEAQEPFFLSVNLQSSHFPYLIPESCDRPFQPCEIDSNASFVYYPQEQTPVVRNAYYNALYECDRQIGRLVAALNKLDSLDDTILVVYGENGEAFHENGCVTHAGPPIEPVVHVACVIHAPDHLQPAIEDYPVELIDLAPTVLGLLKADNHPNFQGIDVLQPNRPPVEERFLFFHTESALSGADALLFVGRWKYSHDRRIGRSQLFDLKQDPNESVNLVNENPHLAKKLDATLKTWRERQLAYYHFPFYYEKYYPPRPPGNE